MDCFRKLAPIIPNILFFITIVNTSIFFFTNNYMFIQINVYFILMILYFCWIFTYRVNLQISSINNEFDQLSNYNRNLRINNLYEFSNNIIYFYKVIKPIHYNINDTCPICLDYMNDYINNPICQLKCSHYFHTDCIKKSIVYNFDKCPLCRFNILS